MRPDFSQPQSAPAPRPIQRPVVGSMPVQRGNYGVPPRQRPTVDPFVRPTPNVSPTPTPVNPSTPAFIPATRPVAPAPTTTPRYMDFQPTQAAPVAATPAPVQIAQPTVAPVAEKSPPVQRTKRPLAILSKLRLTVVVVGAILILAGGVRLATAGSTSGDTIAVGAVKANDTSSVTIQYTADDGRLHYLTLKGNKPTLVPGTAVQVAYQPGAADKTVLPVSKITGAHRLGFSLIETGVALLIIYAALSFWETRRQHKHPASVQQARPVTA